MMLVELSIMGASHWAGPFTQNGLFDSVVGVSLTLPAMQ